MTLRRSFAQLVAATAILAGCAGSGTAPAAPTIGSFDASPATIEVGDSATLSWTVSGSEPVTLTLAPGIGDVSDAVQRVVTPSETTTYTLTASNDHGSDSDQLTIVVANSVRVQGVVLGVDGMPAPGVTVTMPGKLAQVTPPDGRFDFGPVATPYSISTFDPILRRSLTYVGLTVADPTLVILGAPPGEEHTASIYGLVTGGVGFPEPPQHWTQVAYGSPATRATARVDAGTGGYEMVPVTWYGPDATDGALHVLQWKQGPGGLPVDFTGYGTRPLRLHEPIRGYLEQDVVLGPVNEATLDGGVLMPSGYAAVVRTLSTVFDDGAAIAIGIELAFAPSFAYTTPLVPGTSHAVAAAALGPAGEISYGVRANLGADAAGVRVPLPTAASPSQPQDGATGVDHATTFAWDPGSEGVFLIRFFGAGLPTFNVLTDATTATIPELDTVGLGLPPSSTYTWQVYGLGPFDTIDEAASGPDGILSAYPGPALYLARRDGLMSASVQRGFTTRP